MNMLVKDKINVLHIRDSSGMYGAERVILTLGKNIDREKFNFILLCLRRENGGGQVLLEKAREMGICAIPIDERARFDPAAVLKIRSLMSELRISICHSHDYKSGLYAVLASLNTGIKRVDTAHGSTRDSFRKRVYLFVTENIVYKYFDRIIAVSEAISAHLMRHRIKPERIEVIPNGIDISFVPGECGGSTRKTCCSQNGTKVFGVVGRLFPDKGHRFFLEAFGRLLKNNHSLSAAIVGEGPYRDEIEKQVRELGLDRHVCLHGFKSDMKSVYEGIDCLVIPSLREGLPYVVLEAMSLKVPVIASAVGGIPTLIEDGETGYLVPPGDVEALEKQMSKLLLEPSRTEEMAMKAYSRVLEKFSAQGMVEKTEQLYESLSR